MLENFLELANLRRYTISRKTYQLLSSCFGSRQTDGRMVRLNKQTDGWTDGAA